MSRISIADYNNNQLDDNLLISSAATAALATHDYTNRSLANAAEDRCFPCTYQGCVKVSSFDIFVDSRQTNSDSTATNSNVIESILIESFKL